ncbi:MAG: guanylate kinase [Candidatus Moranbacteria bacterium]|nr:guanylate kinase [Candidatus Moranbacteria bacterium]
MQKSSIFIISGPSGAGEDSIINGLKEYFELERIVTTTTRDMRLGEKQGEPYYFIFEKEFKDGIDSGNFAEYAQQYNGNLYGVTKAELERVQKSGKIGIWKIEYKGVMSVKKAYPEIISIFVNAPSLEILEDRIRRRDNATDSYIKERMEYTKEWLKHKDIYDYEVINKEGQLDKAIKEVAEIIKKNI